MPAPRLSKSRIISGLQCPKRLYLEIHHPELAADDAGTEARFATGHAVGEIARQLHPGGHLIEHIKNLPAALKSTSDLLQSKRSALLYEPAFEHSGVLVRVDLLRQRAGALHLTEVKSSTTVKDYHLNDAAIQAWVISGVGHKLGSIKVACIDSSFVYPGNNAYEGLLSYTNITEEIRPLVAEVPKWVMELQKWLAKKSIPDIDMGAQCNTPFACPFQEFCGKDLPEYPVTLLPRGGKVVEALLAEGYQDLKKVPKGKLSNENHLRVWRATRTGKPELKPVPAELIRNQPYPRYYLDFETIQFAVPIWAGTRPYEQLPFQWSCHIENKAGNITHREFLDISGELPVRAFAESLIRAVGIKGPIFVYSSFESRVIRELANRLPEHANALRAINGRLVDLLPVTREHYYHPEMMGSWSIKSVLPTIAPDLNYASLGEVRDGGMAQMAYLELIEEATPLHRKETIIKALLAYCKHDTLGLKKIQECLD